MRAEGAADYFAPSIKDWELHYSKGKYRRDEGQALLLNEMPVNGLARRERDKFGPLHRTRLGLRNSGGSGTIYRKE